MSKTLTLFVLLVALAAAANPQGKQKQLLKQGQYDPCATHWQCDREHYCDAYEQCWPLDECRDWNDAIDGYCPFQYLLRKSARPDPNAPMFLEKSQKADKPARPEKAQDGESTRPGPGGPPKGQGQGRKTFMKTKAPGPKGQAGPGKRAHPNKPQSAQGGARKTFMKTKNPSGPKGQAGPGKRAHPNKPEGGQGGARKSSKQQKMQFVKTRQEGTAQPLCADHWDDCNSNQYCNIDGHCKPLGLCDYMYDPMLDANGSWGNCPTEVIEVKADAPGECSEHWNNCGWDEYCDEWRQCWALDECEYYNDAIDGHCPIQFYEWTEKAPAPGYMDMDMNANWDDQLMDTAVMDSTAPMDTANAPMDSTAVMDTANVGSTAP